MENITLLNGLPQPYGTSAADGGINFAIFSPEGNRLSLCLYRLDTHELVEEVSLDPQKNRTGNVWHIQIQNLPENLAYAYRIGNSAPLLDPYAKAVTARNQWYPTNSSDFKTYQPLGVIVGRTLFDWEGITSPQIPMEDLIIYEMHVRGLTIHSSSGVENKGLFSGIIEKIPYLLDLGVNAIELMPIQEFDEYEYRTCSLITESLLYNYWGYSTINFFSPMARYALQEHVDSTINDFKKMVRELHRNGIEVILDIVFNHTGEGNEDGPMFSFKGLANNIYYMIDARNKYLNFSGCGNTLNCNHPITVEFILDCLRYWVVEMHVDGFRFDLASILTRDSNGHPLANPPLIDFISKDPILNSIKLIAEPWDAGGLYQVGSFYNQAVRWSEWNDKYRDTVRRFIKGTNGQSGEFATRICGSQDLYHNRLTINSINFVTAHDGFTLADLVSYNYKHNQANGESNRDGTSDNVSWNCGIEGTTSDAKITSLRERQVRNFILCLLVSQGVPMLLMGDEYGHTKKGNNNTWCHDNELNWFLWDKLNANQNLYRYFRFLIHFRKRHPIFHNRLFLADSDVLWHGLEPLKPDWSDGNRFLAFTLKDHVTKNDLYVAFNSFHKAVQVHFPVPPEGLHWHKLIDTANPSPNDFCEEPNSIAIAHLSLKMIRHSAVLLKAL